MKDPGLHRLLGEQPRIMAYHSACMLQYLHMELMITTAGGTQKHKMSSC